MKSGLPAVAMGIALLVLLLPVRVAATTLYVTSDVAELKSESSSASDTIVELGRGTVLTRIDTDGRWYRVTTQTGQSGWIYRGKVSEEMPAATDSAEEGGSLGGLLGGLSGSDIRADAADSSRSIRGLSPEAKEYAKATGTPKQSQKALDAVLSRKVSDKEIRDFLMRGKVGEYAD